MRSSPKTGGYRRGQYDRARRDGFAALEDAALLGLVLAPAAPRADVAQLARRLLERFGGLAAIGAADAAEVTCLVGRGCAEQIALAAEVARRLARAEIARRPLISSWSALLAYLRADLAARPREEFRVLFLDKRNQLIRDDRMGSGTVDHAPVYPREVVRRALELSASALILVHNHPSGDPTPSSADVDMTHQVVAAARALNLAVHDHLVVGSAGVASFKSLGLM